MFTITPAEILNKWFPDFTIRYLEGSNNISVSFQLPITKDFYTNHGLVLRGVLGTIPYVASLIKKIEVLQERVDEYEDLKDSIKNIVNFANKR